MGRKESVADLRDVASFRSHVLLPQTGHGQTDGQTDGRTEGGLVLIRYGPTETGYGRGRRTWPSDHCPLGLISLDLWETNGCQLKLHTYQAWPNHGPGAICGPSSFLAGHSNLMRS